jgi:hypothetical protein
MTEGEGMEEAVGELICVAWENCESCGRLLCVVMCVFFFS